MKTYRHQGLWQLFILGIALLPWGGQLGAQGTSVKLPDPTRPYSGQAASPSGQSRLWLQSTVVSKDRRVAVISGHSVTVGSHVHGAKVIDIRPHEVVISRHGRQSTLRLLPGKVVRQTKHAENG